MAAELPDTMPPPPRLTGDQASDIRAQNEYLQELYNNFIQAGGVLLAANQAGGSFNPTEGRVEAYPVGSLFFSTLAADPADQLGYGTWERYGVGRAIVSLEEGDPEFGTVGQESGSKTETPSGTVAAPIFTGAALAGHDHDAGTLAASAHVTGTQTAAFGADFEAVETINDHTITGSTTSDSAGTPSGTNSAPAFTGAVMNVIQPSIAVYIWTRTV